ncbi:hypothetical protein SteCoe_8833 [Stentor coeruleus]|uniref:Uncharacterized protein n=1 Tax=Stentor coeruleus TaxID=5963 RepID=A0A1R2CJD1_9CILI|nr:hypothetical protein SteCoe_8833 [Stentor coeruleus]
MLNCSILTPAFTISSYNYSSIVSQCAENLGVDINDLELYALVPLREVENPQNAVIKLKYCNFSLSKIEEILNQREQLFQQLQKSRDALSSYSERLKDKKEPVVDEKVTRKISKLEEDNKKLRQLLKTQLDNAENLRLATQRTVENLREEFDLLVRELLNVKKAKEKIEETPKTEKKPAVPKLKIGAN